MNELIERMFLPPRSSSHAANVDNLFMFCTYLSLIFFAIVAGAAIYFAWKYRRKSENDKTPHVDHNLTLEIVWSVIPLVLVMIVFFWGLTDYLVARVPPNDSFEVQVTAKKWLWEFQYPDGTKSINKMYVPLGRPIRVVMTSDDVLHSFFLKDFRVKQDIVPGRYTDLWFQATNAGTYQLQCTEYCGKDHSKMLAKVEVMGPAEYAKFLAEGPEELKKAFAENPVKLGEEVYQNAGCQSCHTVDGSKNQGPSWKGIYGQVHQFTDGTSAKVDENYIQNSIINPQGQIVKGFEPIMPTYQGALRDVEIKALIAYIKSLK